MLNGHWNLWILWHAKATPRTQFGCVQLMYNWYHVCICFVYSYRILQNYIELYYITHLYIEQISSQPKTKHKLHSLMSSHPGVSCFSTSRFAEASCADGYGGVGPVPEQRSKACRGGTLRFPRPKKKFRLRIAYIKRNCLWPWSNTEVQCWCLFVSKWVL